MKYNHMNFENEVSITFLMLEHHNKINAKLENLLNGVGMDNNELQNAWRDFCDNLEKHMTIEEQVIFSFSDFGNTEVHKIIREVLSQHGKIREEIKNIQFDRNLSRQLLIELQKSLYDHEAIENQTLYPKIDKDIDDYGRNFLFKKIENSNF